MDNPINPKLQNADKGFTYTFSTLANRGIQKMDFKGKATMDLGYQRVTYQNVNSRGTRTNAQNKI